MILPKKLLKLYLLLWSCLQKKKGGWTQERKMRDYNTLIFLALNGYLHFLNERKEIEGKISPWSLQIWLKCGWPNYHNGVLYTSYSEIEWFLKNLLLYSWIYIWQTEYIVMMTKEGSTKFLNFKTLGQRFLCYDVAIKLYKWNVLCLSKKTSLMLGIDETDWMYSNDNEGRVYHFLKILLHTERGFRC